MYGQRPSILMGWRPDECPVLALDFDQAVAWFGGWIESRLAEVDARGQPIHRLGVLLMDRPARIARSDLAAIGVAV